jgi:RNA polymerase sigma factor for flagellar operon FliA
VPPLGIKKLKRYRQSGSLKETKKNGEERERLIIEYAPLVKTIAGRLRMKLPSHVGQDDLLSAGTIGLLDAIDKFDKTKGVEFKSYAEFRIRGAMIDELRSMDWVPRSVRKNEKRLQDAYAKVEKVKMRPAKDEEVANELDVDLEEFYRLLDQVRGTSILNEEEICDLAPQGAMDSKWTTNWAIKGTDPFQSVRFNEVKKVIAEAIERLPKNERTVMTLYYYEELTMKEIGNIMGYTESRVSQLHTKSVLRLRNSLRTYFGP